MYTRAAKYFAKIGRALLNKQLAPGVGLAETSESIFDDSNPDATYQHDGQAYYTQIALNPWIAASLAMRDVSRLYVSAAGIDADEHGAYFPNQLKPYSDDPLDQAIWEFVAWMIDERLERSMRQVLYQVQRSMMEYGWAVQELDWREETEHPLYRGKIVLHDIWDRDPDRFLNLPIGNKQGREPGLYLRNSIYTTTDLTGPLPPRKFWVVTNNQRYENHYGQSELAPLIETEHGMRNINVFQKRHLEKFGSPQIVARYPEDKYAEQFEDWRAAMFQYLKKAAHQAVIFIPETVQIETLTGDSDADAFVDFFERKIREISVTLLGSPTALMEGLHGSYGGQEAGQTREKSKKEQQDAATLQDAVNYSLIPWAVDWNWQTPNYPFLQLIQPGLIMPTTPKDQDTAEEVEEAETDERGGETSFQAYQEEEESEEDDEKEDKEGLKRGSFPNNDPLPEEYADPDVQDVGRGYLASQPVALRRDWNKLSKAEKRRTFTISWIDDLEQIKSLHQVILDTLDQPSEGVAWEAYVKRWKEISGESGWRIALPALQVSFRNARQQALTNGVISKAKELDARGELFGLRYQTRDDARVRVNHRRMHNVLRPLDDPIWDVWTPINGHFCRCTLQVITISQAQSDSLQYTPDKDLPPDGITPDKGFF